MYCPSCGAPNNERDQRYCRECGASLPAVGTATKPALRRPAGGDLPSIPSSPRGRSSALVSAGMKNKAVMGAVALVVLVVAFYALVHVIIGTLEFLLWPVAIVLAIGALGYFWLKGSRRR